MEVRERNLAADYDWTVNESVTLEALLSVTKLYAVSIENYGEFVACKYEAPGQYIRLDGAPLKTRCAIKNSSDDWFSSEGGQTVCMEEDKTQCYFDFAC